MEPQNIYTVSRLNNEIRFLLEDHFPFVWVEGEISNFAAPHSGHWYFSLKDSQAQVRCCLFKSNQRSLGFLPKDGLHVLIKARASLYPNRGEYQLVADHMEERGEGKLRRAYELLKKKLEAAGLFNTENKKEITGFPKQIGVITSASGAALHDILTALKRRFACVPVIIYPSLVQGEMAAPALVKAIQTANKRNECDRLILARGGGSLEDLWPFNEEMVAYAIYQSNIPIISGVGHEVDFTIADFAADKRAATPTAAAEMITPSQLELMETLARQKQRLFRCLQNKLMTLKQHLIWSQKHLQQQHPKRRLREKMQSLDFHEAALVQLQMRMFAQIKNKIDKLHAELQQLIPIHRIKHLQTQTDFYLHRLNALMNKHITQQKTKLAGEAAKLNALSPLSTLQRGYAVASKDQHIIYSATNIKIGDTINVRVNHGSLDCRVEKVEVV